MLSVILLLAIPPSVTAATIYADSSLSSNCSGNYSTSARDCSGSDGSAFIKIRDAVNSSSVGDVIYMRGGTFKEISIDIPASKNGTAWTAGNFTTLMSYPGEWAIIDASGLSATGGLTDAVIVHPEGFDVGENINYTEYWKFSNFELTGGGSGIALKCRHVKMHYLYIHDNGRSGVSSLQSGILSVNPQYLEVKYSYFKDNIDASEYNMNNSHILLDSDYHDTSANSGLGLPFLENASTHHNEIAYNYFELTGDNIRAGQIAIRHKNQQRFGLNNRNPAEIMSHRDWGDNIHHNIVVGSDEAMGLGQDFVQVHHNITDSAINIGRAGDVPITYHAAVYNNTVKNPPKTSYISSSGLSQSGEWGMLNFYDNLPQQTVHPHIYFYNNIAHGNLFEYQAMPFVLHWDMPANTTNPTQDNSDLVLENNLIHNNQHQFDLIVGHNYDSSFTGCEQQYMSIDTFNSCSESWRSLANVLNWSSSSGDLFLGNTGPQQYITHYDFDLDGTNQICDGGRGINHPYLDGETIPGYIGATNPNDNAWVRGVMFDVTSVLWMMTQDSDAEPSWLESNPGTAAKCTAGPIKIPAAPTEFDVL